MKICDVVINSIWSDPRVKKQIQSYVDNGIELECVGIIEPRYRKEEVEKIPCKVRLADIPLNLYSEKRNIFTKIFRELYIQKKVYKEILKTAPDIIHANDLNALIPAYKVAKKLKCKLIYDTHEIFLENPWIARNPLVKLLWGTYEKRIISKVDLVVCVSHAAGKYLKQKYAIAHPLVVTNCISKKKQIHGTCPKAEPKQILNHGQFYEGRGYDIMVETASLVDEHQDLQFVLRGFGAMENQLRNRVKELGVNNVSFAPPVKVEELIPEAAHAWVALAITEAISLNFKLSVSNKIFEYAAAGLPVIMSDIPEHRYLNDKYNFGIILKSDTPECLAAAINKMYTDQELYNTYVRNVHILSREVNWDNEFGKLIKFEKKLVKEI